MLLYAPYKIEPDESFGLSGLFSFFGRVTVQYGKNLIGKVYDICSAEEQPAAVMNNMFRRKEIPQDKKKGLQQKFAVALICFVNKKDVAGKPYGVRTFAADFPK